MMGTRPEQAAAELEKSGADIIGANCGAGIDQMIELMKLLRSATALPSGASRTRAFRAHRWKTVYRETAEMMASKLKPGSGRRKHHRRCCGTAPPTSAPSSGAEHIGRLAAPLVQPSRTVFSCVPI